MDILAIASLIVSTIALIFAIPSLVDLWCRKPRLASRFQFLPNPCDSRPGYYSCIVSNRPPSEMLTRLRVQRLSATVHASYRVIDFATKETIIPKTLLLMYNPLGQGVYSVEVPPAPGFESVLMILELDPKQHVVRLADGDGHYDKILPRGEYVLQVGVTWAQGYMKVDERIRVSGDNPLVCRV